MTATTNREAFDRFFADLAALDLDAVVDAFTDDGSYHDMPVPTDPAVGKDAIRRKLDFMKAAERIEFRFSTVVEDGDLVLAERIEIWHFPTGETPTLPVMCTMRFRDGKVAAWREYWDMQTLMSQMPASFLELIASAAASS